MGAELDLITVKATEADTDQSLTKFFSEAVAQAAHDHGHAGYTGTIAEKRTDGMAIDWRDPLTKEEWREYQETDDVLNDKWGPARAVRVIGSDGEVNWIMGGWCSS